MSKNNQTIYLEYMESCLITASAEDLKTLEVLIKPLKLKIINPVVYESAKTFKDAGYTVKTGTLLSASVVNPVKKIVYLNEYASLNEVRNLHKIIGQYIFESKFKAHPLMQKAENMPVANFILKSVIVDGGISFAELYSIYKISIQSFKEPDNILISSTLSIFAAFASLLLLLIQ